MFRPINTPPVGLPRPPQSTAYTILRQALGVLLLFAAAMKALDIPSATPLAHDGLSNPYVLIAEVQFEAILGLWLLSNLYARVCWLISLLCFAVFAVVSAHKAIRGDPSCGCFGRFSVNPWHTAAIDTIAVAAILLLRRRVARARSVGTLRLPIATGAACIAIVCIATTFWLLRSLPRSLSESGDLPPADSVVYLQPERWIGRSFPLIKHTTLGRQLAHGRWVVVIYNSYCGHCRPAVPEYEQLAIALQDRPGAPRIALVEVPPCAAPGRNQATGGTPAVVGHLSTERKWLIVTPVILAVVDGRVLAMNAEQPAEAWVNAVFNQH